jgi:hypothetical protein
MVKHKARKCLQGLHNYLLDREEKDKVRLEKAAKKREEKRQQMIMDTVGEGGDVKALDSMRFKGSFGVSFPGGGSKKSNMDDGQDVEMEEEGAFKLCKSVRKQAGLAVAKK